MSVNFEIEKTRIPVGKSGGYIEVRGLNSEDVTFLTIHYLDDMKALLAQYQGRTIPRDAVAEMIITAARDFPSMVVEMISRAAEATDSESVEKLRTLSFMKQLEVLKAIAVLSSEDGVIELKKVLGVVEKLCAANGLSIGPLTKSLQIIIGTFEEQSPS